MINRLAAAVSQMTDAVDCVEADVEVTRKAHVGLRHITVPPWPPCSRRGEMPDPAPTLTESWVQGPNGSTKLTLSPPPPADSIFCPYSQRDPGAADRAPRFNAEQRADSSVAASADQSRSRGQ